MTPLLRPGRFSTEHLRAGLKERAARGRAVTIATQACKQALALGSLMLLARLLTPSDYGLVAMVLGVVAVISVFRPLGLSEATVREREISEAQVSLLFRIDTLTGAALAVLTAALAPAIAWFYAEPRVTQITLLIAPVFLLSAAGNQHRALMRRQMRFRALAAVDLISAACCAATALACAFMGFGYWSLAWSLVAAELAGLIALWTLHPWWPGPAARLRGNGRVLAFGAHLQLAHFLGIASLKFDSILIARLWGAAALGFYNRAFNVLIVPLYQLIDAFRTVAVPSLAVLQGDAARLREHYLNTVSLLVNVTLPPALFCMVMSEEVVGLVLGAKWAAAADILRVLAIAALVMPVAESTKWLNIALGRSRPLLAISAASALVGIAAVGAGSLFGALGVAWALAGFSWLFVLPSLAYLLAGTPVRPRELARAALGPALTGLTVVAVLAGTKAALPWPEHGFAGLAAALVLAPLAWLLASSWFAGHANPLRYLQGAAALVRPRSPLASTGHP